MQDWLSFSRMGAAARSFARSAGVSSRSRRASQASLSLRDWCTRSRPSSVTVSITWRLSVACAARITRPRCSRTAMTLVMEGGCTFSCSASSPGVIAPWRSSVARAPSWVSDSSESAGNPCAARSARSRRASRLTEIRSAEARPASDLVCLCSHVH